MAIESSYDEDARVATHAIVGVIDLPELFRFLTNRLPPFDWTWAVLWDLRGVTDPRPSTEDLLRVFRDPDEARAWLLAPG